MADPIPNIRFNVAKSYSELIKVLKQIPESGTLEDAQKSGTALSGTSRGTSLIQDKIMPNLEKLQQDDDVDVRYFATTAAQSVTGATGDEMQT